MKAPKFTAEQCQAIHDEADKAGKEAANKLIPQFWGCFVWVLVKPATSTFARWMKANNVGRYSEYHKGVMLCVSGYSQNGNQKYAYAAAYANILTNYGIKAYADSHDD